MSPKPKLFRDPVHDIIAFPKDTAEDRTLLAVIETPEVQRLRRVRQLGFSNLVYHGAEHSRFVHSMGVAHVARRMLAAMRPDADARTRLAVTAAALCHDLGHGPFSHVAERIGHFHHEAVTLALVTTPGSGVHSALSRYDSDLPRDVARIYAERGSLSAIVSSQLDADRIDYILRDGLATGVKIGVFDVQRILTMLEEHGNVMAVSERALEAVEGYLLARFHMYKQVYLHKASRAAEAMLDAVIRRARVLDEVGDSVLSSLGGPLTRLIRAELHPEQDIPALDDTDIWQAMKRFAGAGDPILERLSRGLLERRLFKTIPIPAGPEGDAVIESARRTASACGLEPDFAVLIDRSEESPYTPYIPGRGQEDESIPIALRGGGVVPIERISEVIGLLGRIHYRVSRLVVPPELASHLVLPDATEAHDELDQIELPL